MKNINKLSNNEELRISDEINDTKNQVIEWREHDLDMKVDAMDDVEWLAMNPLAKKIAKLITLDEKLNGMYAELVWLVQNIATTPASMQPKFLQKKNQFLTELMDYSSIQEEADAEDLVNSLEWALFQLPELSASISRYISYPLISYTNETQKVRNELFTSQKRFKDLSNYDIDELGRELYNDFLISNPFTGFSLWKDADKVKNKYQDNSVLDRILAIKWQFENYTTEEKSRRSVKELIQKILWKEIKIDPLEPETHTLLDILPSTDQQKLLGQYIAIYFDDTKALPDHAKDSRKQIEADMVELGLFPHSDWKILEKSEIDKLISKHTQQSTVPSAEKEVTPDSSEKDTLVSDIADIENKITTQKTELETKETELYTAETAYEDGKDSSEETVATKENAVQEMKNKSKKSQEKIDKLTPKMEQAESEAEATLKASTQEKDITKRNEMKAYAKTLSTKADDLKTEIETLDVDINSYETEKGELKTLRVTERNKVEKLERTMEKAKEATNKEKAKLKKLQKEKIALKKKLANLPTPPKTTDATEKTKLLTKDDTKNLIRANPNLLIKLSESERQQLHQELWTREQKLYTSLEEQISLTQDLDDLYTEQWEAIENGDIEAYKKKQKKVISKLKELEEEKESYTTQTKEFGELTTLHQKDITLDTTLNEDLGELTPKMEAKQTETTDAYKKLVEKQNNTIDDAYQTSLQEQADLNKELFDVYHQKLEALVALDASTDEDEKKTLKNSIETSNNGIEKIENQLKDRVKKDKQAEDKYNNLEDYDDINKDFKAWLKETLKTILNAIKDTKESIAELK